MIRILLPLALIFGLLRLAYVADQHEKLINALQERIINMELRCRKN